MEHLFGENFKLSDTAVAFGRFDGLHRGHRAVIAETVGMKTPGLKAVLLSLNQKPADPGGTGKNAAGKVLYTEEEKAVLLESSGLDIMISCPFTEETADTDAGLFVKEVLVEKLGAKTVVAGEDIRFGRNLTGDIGLLRKLSGIYGFRLIVCGMEKEGVETISSAGVREALAACRLDKAASLLGAPFTVIGKVVHGKALGRTAGLPTANLDFAGNKFLPPHGIYVTLTRLEGESLRGLTILGLRPTVDNFTYVTLETYLLDFSRDIYGKTLRLEIHERIRDIRKFKDLVEVKKQVDKDIESVREYLDKLRQQK